MTGLRYFNSFDLTGFLAGKVLQVVSIKPWKDFDSDQTLGVKYELAIVKDNTKYPVKDDKTIISNRYEKFSCKVAQASPGVEINSYVEVINGTATIWGEHRDKLSVKCESLRSIDPHKA